MVAVYAEILSPAPGQRFLGFQIAVMIAIVVQSGITEHDNDISFAGLKLIEAAQQFTNIPVKIPRDVNHNLYLQYSAE